MTDWNNTQLTFTVTRPGMLLTGRQDDKIVFFCSFDGYHLDAAIHYDFHTRPLRLGTDAKIGDRVALTILPYRLELRVNGVLLDEEWPCGNHYLADAAITGVDFRLSAPETAAEQPSVISTFENAALWRPEAGIFVGDCMPYVHDGRYHVLYLKDRRRHQSKWGLGAHQWAHISTDDFISWQEHPMAVEIDDPNEGSICTGSWMADGGTHYLYYTVRTCDRSPAWICRSVSEDGYHFRKDRGFKLFLSDKYIAANARDPKIVKAEDGTYHMFLTTSLAKERVGCLAHLVSRDMDNWQELPEPIVVSENNLEPECPDYFCHDGWHYLIYSLGSRARYQYSRQPFSHWITPENPIIPCERVPKMAVWDGRIIFTGFDSLEGGYGGVMTFSEAWAEPDGSLSFDK